MTGKKESPGIKEVGRVYIRVLPNLKRFRQEIEAELKSIGDLKIRVEPDMTGFRRKVKQATEGLHTKLKVDVDKAKVKRDAEAAAKFASATTIKFWVALRSNELKILAAKAALEASGQTVQFKAEIDTSELKRARSLRKYLNWDTVKHPGNLVEPVTAKFRELRAEISRTSDRLKVFSRRVAHIMRSLVSPIALVGKSITWAFGVYALERRFGSSFKRLAGRFLTPVKQALGYLPRLFIAAGRRGFKALLEDLRGVKLELRWRVFTAVENINDKRKRITESVRKALEGPRMKVRRAVEWTKEHTVPRRATLLFYQRRNAMQKAHAQGLLRELKYLKHIGDAEKMLKYSNRGKYPGLYEEYRDVKKIVESWTKDGLGLHPEDLDDVSRRIQKIHKRLGVDRKHSEQHLMRMVAMQRGLAAQKRWGKAYEFFDSRPLKRALAKARNFAGTRKQSFMDSRAGAELRRVIDTHKKLKQVGGFALDSLSARWKKLGGHIHATAERAAKFRLPHSEGVRAFKENLRRSFRASAARRQEIMDARKARRLERRKRRDQRRARRRGQFLGLTRIGWIVGAISALAVPLAQLVGGTLAAIPGLAAAGAAALAATVLGFEGIKDAAKKASPALERAKEAVSGVFRDRLSSQFSTLGDALDTVRGNLVDVAHGMADFSQGFVDGVTGSEGMRYVQNQLKGTARLFSRLKPFAEDFTVALLGVGSAGADTFDYLSDGLNGWAKNFRASVKQMSDSGELQKSIKAAYDVFGSAGTNIGKILGEVIRTAPDMVQPVRRMFDGFADGVVKLIPLFSSFSNVIGNTLGSLFDEAGRLGDVVGPKLQGVMDTLNPAIQDLVHGSGSAISAVLAPIGDFLNGLSPGVAKTLSSIGRSLGDMGDRIGAHPEIGSNLASIGQNLGKIFSLSEGKNGLFGGKPLISDSDLEMLEKMTSGLSTLSDKLTRFAVDLVKPSDQLRASLEMYGSTWSRAFNFGPMMNNLKSVSKQMLTLAEGASKDVAASIENVAAEANRAAAANQIDLSPMISKLSTAKTKEQIHGIVDEMKAAIDSAKDLGESTKIEVDAEAKVDVNTDSVAEDAAAQMAQIPDRVGEAASALGDAVAEQVGSNLQGLNEKLDQQMSDAVLGIGQGLGDALGTAEIPTDALKTNLDTAITTAFTGVFGSLGEKLAGVTASVAPALDGVVNSVADAFGRVKSESVSRLASWGSEVGSLATAAGDAMVTPVESARDRVVAAVEDMCSQAVARVGQLPGQAQAALGDLSGALYPSGQALVQGFINGMDSKAGAVSAAASRIASAARAYFPFSPAKKGPFSGSGYTTFSGAALVDGFIQGMDSQVRGVQAAAERVTSAARGMFRDPSADLEAYHRGKVLQPVLERNAEAIARYRERVEKNEKRASDSINRLADAQLRQAGVERRVAKQREKVASDGFPELDAPDYSKINRSFKSYYIEGTKGLLTDGLKQQMRSIDLAGQVRGVALAAVREGRRVFGSHPMFDQVEANVTAQHFADTLERVIEESGIAEIPVSFAVANLNQLKSDLGMGDGVVARALDAAMSFNPNDTDSARAAQSAAKTEIHYHVADMEEAIRLEQLRERKALLRIK